MVRKSLGHYKIIRQVGSGGMGDSGTSPQSPSRRPMSNASPREDGASPLAAGDVVAHLLDFLADQVANRHYAEQGATLVHDR